MGHRLFNHVVIALFNFMCGIKDFIMLRHDLGIGSGGKPQAEEAYSVWRRSPISKTSILVADFNTRIEKYCIGNHQQACVSSDAFLHI